MNSSLLISGLWLTYNGLQGIGAATSYPALNAAQERVGESADDVLRGVFFSSSVI